MKDRLLYALHNLVAHPLLVIVPPLGVQLHDWSAEQLGWLTSVPSTGDTESRES